MKNRFTFVAAFFVAFTICGSVCGKIQIPAWEKSASQSNSAGANSPIYANPSQFPPHSSNAGQTISLNPAAEERIDASTQEKLNDSFTKVLLALNDADQQNFASAMATIGVIVAEDKSENTQKKLFDIVHGKTASEIIAAARKLTPYIRKYSKIIDGTNEDTFNRSIGKLMVSLPLEKQGIFSESVAKLMYQAQQDKLEPSVLRKKLDGKTADEVIWLAEHINMPFSIVNSSSGKNKEVQITPLTEGQLKDYKHIQTAEDKAAAAEKAKSPPAPKLDDNLSPNALYNK